jgi:hypothetical protein
VEHNHRRHHYGSEYTYPECDIETLGVGDPNKERVGTNGKHPTEGEQHPSPFVIH